ncbi:hypothetical protein Tco_0925341 [Tanacetum coccineum]|uniref:Uncharacterized protein n=1 Tax=Tanacetum coccineum TaxID=301880 RepID=A0ABQ5D970_9ASTR
MTTGYHCHLHHHIAAPPHPTATILPHHAVATPQYHHYIAAANLYHHQAVATTRVDPTILRRVHSFLAYPTLTRQGTIPKLRRFKAADASSFSILASSTVQDIDVQKSTSCSSPGDEEEGERRVIFDLWLELVSLRLSLSIFLDVIKSLSLEYEHVAMNLTLLERGNITRIMRRTLKIILVFTVCERQVYWNSVLTRFIDDLLALDSIVCFGFSDRRLELTATFSKSTNSEKIESDLIVMIVKAVDVVVVHDSLRFQKLYDGNVIKNTSAIVILDSEETLMLTEESLLIVDTTKVEVPKELPKVSMVNTSLKKLKHHLAGFDVVVKERTTAIAITKGSWGFEHTISCFRDEIIPFVKALKDIFNTFDQYLIDELSEVQNIFHQIEQAVEQHRLESFTTLEKHCISLEVDTQLNQEIFQRDNFVSNQSAPNFDQYFELNELKAQSQEKDTVIKKLKERIKSLNGNMNEDKVKKDIEEIETINIELDHRVSRLIAENEHLK